MASINRLKPGQVVYSVEKTKMGNTTMYRKAVFSVLIKEINAEQGYVIASWNNNPDRKFFEFSIKKWKVRKPTK